MCSSCFAIPSVTIQLFVTSAALLYGQRVLVQKRAQSTSKWTKRVAFGITVLVSIALSGFGAFLFALATNDNYRRRGFADFLSAQSAKPKALDEYRCSILERGNVSGRVLEFGPGPGANFKCFQNTTSARSIERYVAVEPNEYFKEEMRKEKDARGLDDFPLEIVGLRGEDIDIAPEDHGSFDVVVLTHVLCSVDSVQSVLANAEKALKPNGGRIVFMEHVLAPEGTITWYVQRFMAPALYILANGCTFKDLVTEMGSYLGNRFDIDFSHFEAPMPWFMHFVRPHIKGVATKR